METITLIETLQSLRKEGYTEDFNLQTDRLTARNGELILHPEDFQIDKYQRFEGESDPDDSSILYAISSKKHGVKGVLVNAYGIYSESLTDEMLEKLK